MGFLRRIRASLGGSDTSASPHPSSEGADGPTRSPADAEASERAYELDLLRAEQDRIDDLGLRQLRYQAYSWRPPAQGGQHRADEGEGSQDTDEREGDAP